MVLAVLVVGTRPFLVAWAIALSTALVLIPNAGAVRIGEVPLEPGSGPNDVVTGPDGNLYVMEDIAERVDRVRPDGGIIGQFALLPGANPIAITAGPDGNLWVSEFSHKKIAKVTTAGGIVLFPAGTTAGSPRGIAPGPDGNIWIVESGPDMVGVCGSATATFSSLRPPGGRVTSSPGPTTCGSPRDLVRSAGSRPPAPCCTDFTAGISPGAVLRISSPLGPDGKHLVHRTRRRIGRHHPRRGGDRVLPPRAQRRPVVQDHRRAGRQSLVHPVQRRSRGAHHARRHHHALHAGRHKQRIADRNRHGTGRPYRSSRSTTATGSALSLWEAPTAVTGGATSIRPDSATVTATVNPLDYPTTVRFDYGPSAAYGSLSTVALPVGSTDVAVPGELTGLSPWSTVHFRVVATSAIGTTMGSDATLITPPFPRVVTPIRSRFSLFPRFTRVTRLKVLRVPAGVRIQLRCRGGGCFKRVKQVRLRRAARSVDLRRRFLRRTRSRPRPCSRCASWRRLRSGRSCASRSGERSCPVRGCSACRPARRAHSAAEPHRASAP